MGIFDWMKKKPKPDFSNVRSGGSSTAPTPQASRPPAPVPPAPDTRHVVVKGESLSKIAKHYYGDPNKWPIIFEANRDKIKDPDLIHPGQELRIPKK